MKKTLFLAGLVIFLAGGAWGDDFLWTGGALNNSWTDPNNWEDITSSLPATNYPGQNTNGDTALIDNGDTVEIIVPITYDLDALTITGSTLITNDNVTALDIDINDTATLTGSINFPGGGSISVTSTAVSIIDTGADIVTGILDLGSRDITITGTGDVTLGAIGGFSTIDLNLSGPGTIDTSAVGRNLNSTTINSGVITFSSALDTILLTINPGATLDMDSYDIMPGGGSFTNDGILRLDGGTNITKTPPATGRVVIYGPGFTGLGGISAFNELELEDGTHAIPVGVTMNALFVSGGTHTSVANLTFPNLTMTGGTFSPGADNTIAGNVTLSGGTLDGSSVNLNVGGDWLDSSGFYSSTAGTVTFIGAASQSVNSVASTFYNIVVDKAVSTDAVSMNSPLNAANEVTITQGILDLGSYDLSAPTITNNGMLSLNGAASQTVATGATLATPSTVGGTGTVVFTAGGTTLAGIENYTNVTINHGGVARTGGALTVTGDLIQNGGTLNATSLDKTGGTMQTSGIAAPVAINGTVTATGAITTGPLTIAGTLNTTNSSGAITVNGTLTINPGQTLDLQNNNLSATAITNNGTLNLDGATGQMVLPATVGGTGTVVFANGGTILAGITNFTNVTINDGSRTGGALTVTGNLEIQSSGSLDLGTNGLNLGGDLTNNAGAGGLTCGTLTLNGTSSQDIDAGGSTVGALNVGNTTGVILQSNLTVNGAATVTSGYITGNTTSETLYVGTNWTNNSGTGSFSTGTVEFTGTGTIDDADSIFDNVIIASTGDVGLNSSLEATTVTNNNQFNLGAHTLTVTTTFANAATALLFLDGNNTTQLNIPVGQIGGTVEFNGTGTTLAGRTSFTNLTINSISGTRVTAAINVSDALILSGGDLTINSGPSTAGSFSQSTGDLSVTGNLTVSGDFLQAGGSTLTVSGGDLILSGSANDIQTTSITMPSQQVNITGTYTATGSVDIPDLNITGSLNMGSGNLTVDSLTIGTGGTLTAGPTITVNGGTWSRTGIFTSGTGLVIFNGTVTVNDDHTAANAFNDVTCNGTVNFGGNNVFNEVISNGTVSFNGITGNTFATLTCSGGTITFADNSTQTIGTLVATAATATDLKSVTTGTERWEIILTNTPLLGSFVTIYDCESSPYLGWVDGTNALKGGNNNIRIFKGGSFYWIGGSDTDWNNPGNWSNAAGSGGGTTYYYPDPNDDTTVIYIQDVSSFTSGNELILERDVTCKTMTIEGSATIDLVDYELVVADSGGLTIPGTGTIKLFGSTDQVTVNNAAVTGYSLGPNGTIHYYDTTPAPWVFLGTYANLVVANTAVMDSITSLTVNGWAEIGSDIITTGTTGTSQTYTGSVTLDADVTFTGVAGTTVLFGSTVQGINADRELTIATANVRFEGNVGTNIASVSVDGTTRIGNNSGAVDITTTNTTGTSQTYTGAVTLDADVTFTGVAGTTVLFKDTVQGVTSARTLTVTTANAQFEGNVGTNIANVSVDGATRIGNNSGAVGITTTDTTGTSQTYTGAVTLDADVTFTGSAGTTVLFGSTVQGINADRELIISAANAQFEGNVGTNIASVSVDGTTRIGNNSGPVDITTTNTTGTSQTYTGAVTLDADVTFTGAGAGVAGTMIWFKDTVQGINSARELTVATGNVQFDGAVGTTTPPNYIASVSVTDAASISTINANITSTGNQNYGGAVVFGSSLRTLTSTGGSVTANGIVSGTAGATVNASQGITIDNTGNTLSGSVTLNNNQTGTAPGGNVIFNTITTANVIVAGNNQTRIFTVNTGGNLEVGTSGIDAGTINITSTGGGITQAGVLTGTDLVADANNGIILNAANQINGSAALNNTQGTPQNSVITFNNAGSLDLSAVNGFVTGSVSIANTGNLQIVSPGIEGGAVTINTTGTITITSLVDGRTGTTSITATSGNITGSGTISGNVVSLETVGSGDIGLSGTINSTTTVALSAADSITGTGTINARPVSGDPATGNVVTLTAINDITINDDIISYRIVAKAGSSTTSSVTISGDINVYSPGNEGDTGTNAAAVYVLAGTLAGSSAINLNDSGETGEVCVYIATTPTYNGTVTSPPAGNPIRIHYHAREGHIIYRNGADDGNHGISQPYFYIDSSIVPVAASYVPVLNHNIYIIDVGTDTKSNTFIGNGGHTEFRGVYNLTSGTLTLSTPGSIHLADTVDTAIAAAARPATITLAADDFNMTGINIVLDGGTATSGGPASITATSITLGSVTCAGDLVNNLTLSSAGAISVGTIGTASSNRLGNIVVDNSSLATFTGVIHANSFTQNAGNAEFSNTAPQNYYGNNGAGNAFQFEGTDLTVHGVIGTTGSIQIVDANDVQFNALVSAASFSQSAGTGTTTFGAAQTYSSGNSSGNAFDFTGNNLILGTNATLTATGTGDNIEINNSGTFTQNTGADIDLKGTFTQTGSGLSVLYAKITTDDAAIGFTGSVRVAGTAVELDSGANAGNITFSSAVYGTTNLADHLSLTAGGGDIIFSSTIGAITTLGNITVVSAEDVTFNGAVFANSFTQEDGSGTTLINAPQTYSGVNSGYAFWFTGEALTIANNGTTTDGSLTATYVSPPPANGGAIRISNNSDYVQQGEIVTTGTFTQDGIGDVLISAGIEVTNTSKSFAEISFTSHVELADDVTFKAPADGGTVTLGKGESGGSAVPPPFVLTLEGGAAASSLELSLGTGVTVDDITIAPNSYIAVSTGNTIQQTTGRILTLEANATLDARTGIWNMGEDAVSPKLPAAFTNGFAGFTGELVLGNNANLYVQDFYNDEEPATPPANHHKVTINGTDVRITTTRHVWLNKEFTDAGTHNLNDSTLVMSGPGTLTVLNDSSSPVTKPLARIGNFIVAAGTVTLANNVNFSGDVTINNGAILDGKNKHIRLFPLAAAPSGTRVVANTWEQIGNGAFDYNGSTVEFGDYLYGGNINTGNAYTITGNTTWYTLACHEPAADIRFSNWPDNHVVWHTVEISPYLGSPPATDPDPEEMILITKLTGAGSAPTINVSVNYIPPTSVTTDFWYFDLRYGAELKLDYVYIQYCWSRGRIPLPRGQTDLRIIPIPYMYFDPSLPNPTPTNPNPDLGDPRSKSPGITFETLVEDTSYASYYNVNWFVADYFFYSFTEDSNGDGKIDRIRAQAGFYLDWKQNASGNYIFEVDVPGYRIDTDRGVTVPGYDIVTGHEDCLYIYLKEQPGADGNRILSWRIVKNESLWDAATGFVSMNNATRNNDGVTYEFYHTTDTVPPRINYALALPDHDEIFFQMSKPVTGDISSPDGVVSNLNRAPITSATTPGTEFLMTGTAAYSVSTLVTEPVFTLQNVRDSARLVEDIKTKPGLQYSYQYPSPKYPTDWAYSNYVEVHHGWQSNGIWGDVNEFYTLDSTGTKVYVTTPASPDGPPDTIAWDKIGGNKIDGHNYGIPNTYGSAKHRVTDILISIPPRKLDESTYFIWPLWAKYDVLYNSANDDDKIGMTDNPGYGYMGLDGSTFIETSVIWDFTGKRFLEHEGAIVMQSRLNDTLSSPSPQLVYGFGIQDQYKSTRANGSAGLWHPGYAWPLPAPLPVYPSFVNLVPQFYPREPLSFNSSPASPLFNFTFPELTGNGKIEFYYHLDGTSSDLLAGRLDVLPEYDTSSQNLSRVPWYLWVKPFAFDIHDITRQRGGVTVLNNVINSNNRERVYLDYMLKRSGRVTIQVFTLDGNLVKIIERNAQKNAGNYRVSWDGTNSGGRPVARGMYFIRIVAPDIDEIRKVMVVK